jgi:ubiquinone/menaquinone biosynthesis C-methylase UbiE
MPFALQQVYWSFRSRVGAFFRKYRWLSPVATGVSGAVLTAVIIFHWHIIVTLVAECILAITAFVWGYSARGLRVPPWQAASHFRRRQYAETWNALASSRNTAGIAVSGSSGWERDLQKSAAKPIQNLVDLASVGPQDDLLEIACGIGRIAIELAPRCRSWTGADISSNMLAYAAERLKGIPNVRLQQLDGTGLNGLAADSFDVVYCTNTLAHLDELDRWRYVQEAFRVLRPGGRILIDNIDLASNEGWASFLKLVETYRGADQPPYMTRFSTAAELMEYASRAGFEQVTPHHRTPLIIVTGVKSTSSQPSPQPGETSRGDYALANYNLPEDKS